MDNIYFKAAGQSLVKTGGLSTYASDTVEYIQAEFVLSDDWYEYDSIRAIWQNGDIKVPAVISQDKCMVPFEVLAEKGTVSVNLVASSSDGLVLTKRITSYPIKAFNVTVKVNIDGTDPQTITPTQFEQFVEAVKSDADKTESEAENALASAQASEASAIRASGHALDAESAETGARAYAQSAQNSATSAENAKDDAIDARDEIRSMRANAETLEPNQSATASYSNGVLTLGIPKGQKGDTGDTGATGPKGETGPQGPKGDDGTVPDLDLILPTDTASGDIVSIPDGQSIVPVKSLKVTLEPIQDLHGYDKPWSGGAGKNKLPMFVDTIKSINTLGTWAGDVYTLTGITFTLQTNDSGAVTGIKATGTATTQTLLHLYYYTNGSGVAQTLNGNPTATTAYRIGMSGVGYDTGNGLTVPTSVSNADTYIQINSGTAMNGEIFKPMIRLASETDATFAPYSNICPIDGWTDVDTHMTGVNVWDEEWIYIGGSVKSANRIPLQPNTTYFFVAPTGSEWANVYCKDADGNSTVLGSPGYPFTTTSDTVYGIIATGGAYGTTYKNDISINYPSTDHEYHAYNGQSYTTALGRTVYGGTLDVVSGELVVDRAIAVFDGTETYDGRYMPSIVCEKPFTKGSGGGNDFVCNYCPSSITYLNYSNSTYQTFQFSNAPTNWGANSADEMKAKIAEWYANGEPLTIAYPLATPQTYQLTPQTISLLHGNNNVWSDGEVEVVYNADVQLWVLKQLS